jgi:hypothetical protein
MMGSCLQGCFGGFDTRDASKCCANRHAYAGGVAFAKHVARHHFSSDK